MTTNNETVIIPPVANELYGGVVTDINDITPKYYFASTKSGTVQALFKANINDEENVKIAIFDEVNQTWGQGFQSIVNIKMGTNLISFKNLSPGLYKDKELKIIDDAGNVNVTNLIMTEFTILSRDLYVYIPNNLSIIINHQEETATLNIYSSRNGTFEIIHDTELPLSYINFNNNIIKGYNNIEFNNLINKTYSNYKLKVTDYKTIITTFNSITFDFGDTIYGYDSNGNETGDSCYIIENVNNANNKFIVENVNGNFENVISIRTKTGVIKTANFDDITTQSNNESIVIIPNFTIDNIGPILYIIKEVPQITNNSSPSITFYSSENGIISHSDLPYTGQNGNKVKMGSNTITFNNLIDNEYSNKKIRIEDEINNNSTDLNINTFEIDRSLANLNNIYNWIDNSIIYQLNNEKIFNITDYTN